MSNKWEAIENQIRSMYDRFNPYRMQVFLLVIFLLLLVLSTALFKFLRFSGLNSVTFDQINIICIFMLLVYLSVPFVESLSRNLQPIRQTGFWHGLIGGVISGIAGGWQFLSADTSTSSLTDRLILLLCFTGLVGLIWGQTLHIFRYYGDSDRIGLFRYWRKTPSGSAFVVILICLFTGLIYYLKIIKSGEVETFLGIHITQFSKPSNIISYASPPTGITYRELIELPCWFCIIFSILTGLKYKYSKIIRLINGALSLSMTLYLLLVSNLISKFPAVLQPIDASQGREFLLVLSLSILLGTSLLVTLETLFKGIFRKELKHSLEYYEQHDMIDREFKGYIDVAIISVTEDEQRAMRRKLVHDVTKNGTKVVSGRIDEIYYSIYRINTDHNAERLVLHARQTGQGNVSAARTSLRIATIFEPKVVFLVGISGGIADNDFSYGDVLFTTKVIGFGQTKYEAGGENTYNPDGGSMSESVLGFITSLGARSELGEWWHYIDKDLPSPDKHIADLKNFKIKSKEDNDKLSKSYIASIVNNFENEISRPRPWHPKLCESVTASNSGLIRDAEIVAGWRRANRKIINVDMECVGVFHAISDLYPLVIIRTISDIIGISLGDDRDDRWTKYACESAAAIAFSLIKKHPDLPKR